MRRAFWVAVGVGAGATAAMIASRWVRRQARALAPASVARQAGGAVRDLGSLMGSAAREFRTGMEEKEEELRSSLAE